MKALLFLLLSTLTVFSQPNRTDQMQVSSGGSRSNAWVGGRIYSRIHFTTNCCAANIITNLQAVTIPADMLENTGDTVGMLAFGRFSTTGQSKRLLVVYGSETLLDTGLRAVSNGTWRVAGSISYLTPTSQYYAFDAKWDRAVAGGGTNVSGIISQTNGIDISLLLQGAANVVSSITNEVLYIDYSSGPHTP